ncbi:hypothetical protein Tco_1098136, partial [Tanacetum coccineum]
MKEEDVDLDLVTCMASESDSSQPLPEVSDVKTSTSTATEQINSYAVDSSSQPTTKVTDVKPHTSTVAKHVNISAVDSSFAEPTPIVSSSNDTWVKECLEQMTVRVIIRFVVGFLVAELPKLEIRKEEDVVKPSSLSKDSYAFYPYSIPKSWEIQSFVDKTLDLPNFSAEQRLNA